MHGPRRPTRGMQKDGCVIPRVPKHPDQLQPLTKEDEELVGIERRQQAALAAMESDQRMVFECPEGPDIRPEWDSRGSAR
jgi:hypothetical protein